MDILREVIGRKSNDTVNYPAASEWFKHIFLSFEYAIPLYIGCACTALVMLLGAVHLYYVLRFISNEQIQTDLYWIVFMCPVVSLCATMGMILPRSAIFLYAIALVYFMLCIFVMVMLMTTLNGSRKLMCERLLQRDVKLSLRVMPIGCCFFCLPKLKATEYNFRRVEWLVFQSPLVRIFLEILNIVVFFEMENRRHFFFQLTNFTGMCSLFVGSYGSYIIIPPGSKLLTAYRFSLMFRIVDFSQLAYSVQKFSFDFLAAIGAFSDGPYLPDSGKAQFFTSFILAVEMLLVSVLGTILFRPSQTVFFDKYPGSGSEARGRLPVKNASNVSSVCNIDQQTEQFSSRQPNSSDDIRGSGGNAGENNGWKALPADISFNQATSNPYASKSEWHNNVFIPPLSAHPLSDILEDSNDRDEVDEVSNFYLDSTSSSLNQETFGGTGKLSGANHRNYCSASGKRISDKGITNISAIELADPNRLSSFLLNKSCVPNRWSYSPDDKITFPTTNNLSPVPKPRQISALNADGFLPTEVDFISPPSQTGLNVILHRKFPIATS